MRAKHTVLVAVALLMAAAPSLTAQGISLTPYFAAGTPISDPFTSDLPTGEILLDFSMSSQVGAQMDFALSKSFSVGLLAEMGLATDFELTYNCSGCGFVEPGTFHTYRVMALLALRPFGSRPDGRPTPFVIELGGGIEQATFEFENPQIDSDLWDVTGPVGFAGIAFDIPVGARRTAIRLLLRGVVSNAFDSDGVADLGTALGGTVEAGPHIAPVAGIGVRFGL
jgi:hypothetical protein